MLKNHEAGDEEEDVTSLLLGSLKGAVMCVDLVIVKQLLSPLVDAITAHVKIILLPLLKEGVTSQTLQTPSHRDDASVCSRPVQTLVKLIPDIIRAHLQSLANCPPVGCAMEEMGLRVLHLYVTVASLVRCVPPYPPLSSLINYTLRKQ